ncbi:hypothetical protein PENSTE_c006G00169 [Penicillium steckii]|uniref:LTD domain-containing protein n=1 Tax=Penicillium steckii TaxID=303698 RepID=A0A1V6TGK2_9EURO|nr:hypothetical protein PENSTE_c006G00169 [Penicillium steckii]
MPLRNYGVWKGIAKRYIMEHDAEDPDSPHLSLYYYDGQDQSAHSGNGNGFHQKHNYFNGKNKHKKPHKPHPGQRGSNKEIPGLCRAAINIKSGDSEEKRLAYWVNRSFSEHPMVNNLANLDFGFHSLKNSDSNDRLDFIRNNLFSTKSGRILPHDIPGPNNDLIDVLEPEVDNAIEEDAEVYIFGDKFSRGGNGIHNVHMNQGNVEEYEKDDGVFQDGGLLIHYPKSDDWIGVFLGFGSQSVHTDNDNGHATSDETWADYLSPESQRDDLIENSVSIDEASWDAKQQDPSRRRKSSVKLSNLTDHKIPLSSWKVKNSAGKTQDLPREANLDAKSTSSFDLPDMDFSKIGDTVTLLNEKGLKVDGVSYNSHSGVKSQPVVFAH